MNSRTPDLQVDLRIVKLVGTMPGGVLTLFPSPSADEPQMDALLTTEQVADILGSSANHLRNIARDVLPFAKIGGNTRFKLSDVLEYIDSCTHDEREPRKEKAAARAAKRKDDKKAARTARQDAATV